VEVEQLCARSAGAPSVEALRPRSCAHCGQLALEGGRLRIQGHGCYSRQVLGLEAGWLLIWVRRYRCIDCGRTMSRLPDGLHPWRWYAAAVIIEALYLYLILRQTAQAVGARFGRPAYAEQWRSLDRWRAQLLASPTLWGWLGARLGIGKPAGDRPQGLRHLTRYLGEIRIGCESGDEVPGGLAAAVRGSLSGLVHNRRQCWPAAQFRPGSDSGSGSGSKSAALPTEKDSSRGPPR
jgi:hypothetical protein